MEILFKLFKHMPINIGEDLTRDYRVFEYLSEQPIDRGSYINFMLTKSEQDFNQSQFNSLENTTQEYFVIEHNKLSFMGTETIDIQKATALLHYLSDYTPSKDSEKRNWFIRQKKILYQILNHNKVRSFSINKNYLYRQVMFGTVKGSIGRLYSDRTSIQMLSKEIRFFLFNEDYFDFDIVNSQFSCLADFAKSLSLDLPSLYNYVENREDILSKKMKLDNISRDLAKKKLIIALNAKESYGRKQGFFSAQIVEDITKLKYFIYKRVQSFDLTFVEDFLKRSDITLLMADNDVLTIREKLINIYVHQMETQHLINLHNFLSDKLTSEADKLNEYGRTYFESLFKEPETLFSFIPFFDGAYIRTNNAVLNSRLKSYVEEYNQIQKNNNSYIRFDQKSLEVDYENIDILILNKYYAIKVFLMHCPTKHFYKLLQQFNMTTFELKLNTNITPDNLSTATEECFSYRKKIYEKLQEYSLEELRKLTDDLK